MSNDFIWYAEELPDCWSYGVTHDGRVFFINDDRHFTTWCHPLTHHPVQSGSYEYQNLPKGWQLDLDRSSAPYFINHLNQVTSRTAPNVPAFRSNKERDYEYLDTTKMKVEVNPSVKMSRVNPAVVRIRDAPTEMEGWLLRQEGIFKQWKKRWFVLSRNQLYCYKDQNGRRMITSYPLSGTTFTPCYGEPGILKTFAFKITQKKKVVYLAAENPESYDEWKEAFEKNANDVDNDGDVFKENYQVGASPFPHHLAQRSNSISGTRDSFQQNYSDLDIPQKRSQSYHNLDRSKVPDSLHRDETERWRGSVEDVMPLQRGFSEQRTRVPLYSPDEGALKLPGNLDHRVATQNSPRWGQVNGAADKEFQQGSGARRADVLRNGNPPKEPPLFGQHTNNSNRNLADRGDRGVGGPTYEGHLRVDRGGRINSMGHSSSPATAQHHNSSYLSNFDENVKTWKSFERSPEGADRSTRFDDGNSPRQSASIQFSDRSFVGNNPSHNSSFTKENPEQLYSKVMKPKGPIPQRPNPSQTSPWANNPLQRNSGSYSGLNSRNPSDRSIPLPPSNNFDSVSKYNSKPSMVPGGGLGSRASMENFYNPSYGLEGANVGHSADSLNTLKTNGSSKSSSKNTYYLSSTAALDDNGNNADGSGNRSYYVVENGTNNFQNSRLQSYGSPTFGKKNPNDPRTRNNVPRNFSAIKEDPDMSDDQVLSSRNLEDLQKKLANHTRLRLSISVQDLMGKSYEEVVLFLIQLKRSQSELHQMCNKIKRRLDSLPQSSTNQVADRRGLEREIEKVEKQIEVTQPLINLLDNMLTMGSLFSGDSLLYASQYKKNQLRPDESVPPKAMLEFNRSRQENLVGKIRPRSGSETDAGQNGEGSNVPRTSELESELRELHRMDVLLQEKSSSVSGLQKDKEMIERAVNEIKVKLSNSNNDPLAEEHLTSQRILLERDLSSTVVQLAAASKQLEEATAGMVKSEQKVIHLRNKLEASERDDLNNGTGRPYGNSNIRGSQRMMQLERQVEEIGNVLRGTSGQMNAINDNITSIRRSRSSHSLTRKEGSLPGRTSGLGIPGYLETDLDRNTTEDTSLGVNQNRERISRRDRFGTRSPRHDSSFQRSTSIPRRIDDVVSNQFRNPYDRTTRPGFPVDSSFGSGPNGRYSGSAAGSRNRDSGRPGSGTGRSSHQADGLRSTDSQNSWRGRRSPYSQNSSQSFSKPAFHSNRGSYDQVSFPSNNVSGDDEVTFNEMTIDKALFHPPPRVQIPQRYFPDPDETLESVDPVDIYHKQQKAEQVKKLLAIQSLQDFTLDELGRADGNIEDRIRSELKEREDILEMKKSLAKQATERSRNFINS